MPRPPRQPKGVPARVKDARAYNQALRTAYLDPFFTSLRRRLANVTATNQAFQALSAGVTTFVAQALSGVPLPLIIESLGKVNGYNRAKLITDVPRPPLGVDVRQFILDADAATQSFMTQRITENVNLIKTIPHARCTKVHCGIKDNCIELRI